MNAPNNTQDAMAAFSPAHGSAVPPFKDRQKVSLARWDKHSPPWDRMGECIVVGQKQQRGCESGWMVTVMAKDGTYRELDSHWIQPNA